MLSTKSAKYQDYSKPIKATTTWLVFYFKHKFVCVPNDYILRFNILYLCNSIIKKIYDRFFCSVVWTHYLIHKFGNFLIKDKTKGWFKFETKKSNVTLSVWACCLIFLHPACACYPPRVVGPLIHPDRNRCGWSNLLALLINRCRYLSWSVGKMPPLCLASSIACFQTVPVICLISWQWNLYRRDITGAKHKLRLFSVLRCSNSGGSTFSIIVTVILLGGTLICLLPRGKRQNRL